MTTTDMNDLVSRAERAEAALAAAQQEIETLRAALHWYEHQFCEGYCAEADGIFDDDVCSGCRARAALSQKEGL